MVFVLEFGYVGQLVESSCPGNEAVDYRASTIARGLQLEAREHFFFSQFEQELIEARE
jgi:hypothetical protein